MSLQENRSWPQQYIPDSHTAAVSNTALPHIVADAASEAIYNPCIVDVPAPNDETSSQPRNTLIRDGIVDAEEEWVVV